MQPRLFRSILLISFWLQSFNAIGQDSSHRYVDISTIPLAISLTNNVSTAYLSGDKDLESAYKNIKFTPGLINKGTVPPSNVPRKLILRFNARNSADSNVSIYFFPGFYYTSINLYREQANGLVPLPRILPNNEDSIGYRLITLGAGDSAAIYCELVFAKTYINTIRPRLVNTQFLTAFIAELRTRNIDNDLVTYIICGLLLMMILYSLANFLQGANREFLYYSGYAIFLGFMLFTKALYNYQSTQISIFFEAYLDFILQGLGYIFFMIFMRRFLETKQKYPFLYKLYNAGISILLFSLVSYTVLHFFTDYFFIQNWIENATKFVLIIMIVSFLVYSLGHWSDQLMRYLFWGNLCLFVFSMISQIIILIPALRGSGILASSLFYYEVAILLDLVFFLAGLSQKNRLLLIEQTKERETLKAQNQLKEYEKEIAVYKAQQEERQRISADMHDELGSGVTAIRLMSEIARNKMKDQTPVEIEKISASADDVLNKMNAIIWSMNSGNDTLDNLVSYIRSYTHEYFENTPIQCEIQAPDHIPQTELSGDKRRNVFLSVKESLHNVLKHANASALTLKMETNHELKITIKDNGKGIDMENLRRFGNGLKNITRRMDSVGGSFRIENNNGTVTTLVLPL